MISLGKHIEILLLDNDCVIIPEFGGFVAHHRNAIFDEEENTFLPPFRSLGFNPQLKINDSLLASSYVEAYDISYPEALTQIEKEVKELKSIIEDKGQYEFNGLGTLFSNIEGTYRFEAKTSGILTPEYYALGSTDILPLNKIHLFGKLSNKKRLRQQKGSETNVRMIQLRKSIASNIAVAAIVALAFMLFTKPTLNSSLEQHQQAVTKTIKDILPKTTPIKNVKENNVTKINNKSNSNTLSINNNISKQTTDNTKDTKNKKLSNYYTIVLASKVSKANGQDFVNRLHKRGLTLANAIQQSSGTRVIYGQYETEGKAYEELSSIRKDKELKDAWVMKISE